MPVSTQVIGVRRITMKFLNAFGLTSAINRGVKEEAEKVVKTSLAGAGNYPPAPTSSTYIRTFRLGNSWSVVQQGWMRYLIENPTTYAMFVVGNAQGIGQAWMHVRRWWKMRDRVQAALPAFRKAIRKRVTDYLS
jgi:hypothetical protein